MAQSDVSHGRQFEGYWRWFAVALFLLIPGDLVTTMGAATRFGFGGEANPLVRWLLKQGPGTLIAVNLAALVLAVYAFKGVISGVREAPAPYDRYFERAVQGWLGFLIVAGLLVVANNLLVIAAGRSLV